MRNQVHGCGAQQLFAANMRRIRLERKLTQEKVAELADLHPNYVGVSEFLCKRFGLQLTEMRSPN